MRNFIATAAFGAAMILYSFGAASAGSGQAGAAGKVAIESGATLAQWGYCQRLRWRCEHKYELGQEGQGNCQRYREECGGGASYCDRLRWRCEHKYELGQEGQGNCQRYREECGGRY